MALTSNSSSTSYIGAADLLSRFDYRSVGMLCSDDNTQCGYTGNNVTYANILSAITTSGTPYFNNFTAASNGASGMLEAAVLKGDRYQPTDLQALTGVSLEFLKDVVAALLVMRLYNRRGGLKPSDLEMERYTDARKILDDLSAGSEIFSFQQTEDAGIPDSAYLTQWQIQRQMYLPVAYSRCFGIRSNQEYPAGWGYGGSGFSQGL